MYRTGLRLREEERRGEEEKEQLTKQRGRKKECKTCFALWKSERRREYQTLRIRNSGSSSCWPHQKRKCFTYPSRVCRHSLSTLVAGTRLDDGSIGWELTKCKDFMFKSEQWLFPSRGCCQSFSMYILTSKHWNKRSCWSSWRRGGELSECQSKAQETVTGAALIGRCWFNGAN